MKKSIYSCLLTVLFIGTGILNAQQITGNGNFVNKERTIESFSKIQVNGSIDVVLEQGDKGVLNVMADENLHDIIVTSVENNTLVISTKRNSGFSTKNKTEVHIYNSKIESLQLNGSGDAISKGKFSFADFEIAITGSGDVDLHADANNLSLSTHGSGDIKLEGTFNTVTATTSGSGDIGIKGSATSLTFSTTGSGDLDAFALKANDVSVTTTGSGDAKVNAEKSLMVKSNGSGDVVYKGNPVSKSITAKGSGECHQSN